MGDRSAQLTQLVVTGAELGLAVVAARVALAALLVVVARGLRAAGRGRAACRCAAGALRVSPALARASVGALLGAVVLAGVAPVGAATASTTAAVAHRRPGPALPALDRLVEEQPVATPPVYVVRPGDSLWSVAAARLGPRASDRDVARAWPRWFAANRHVVGDDPRLIRPGQRLRPPASIPRTP